jgi:hypothetical protein
VLWSSRSGWQLSGAAQLNALWRRLMISSRAGRNKSSWRSSGSRLMAVPLAANLAVEGITNRSNPESRNARKQQRTIAFLAKSNTCSGQITASFNRSRIPQGRRKRGGYVSQRGQWHSPPPGRPSGIYPFFPRGRRPSFGGTARAPRSLGQCVPRAGALDWNFTQRRTADRKQGENEADGGLFRGQLLCSKMG